MIQVTAIGSLPHHNVDAALSYVFKYPVPFYPQIPLRGAAEFMIPQALESLPGVSFGSDGVAVIDRAAFRRGREEMKQLLFRIIDGQASWIFPPEYFSAWAPFLYELRERRVATVKTQMAGPLTCQWVLTGGSKIDPEIGPLVTRLILAKALTMVRELKARGAQPIFYVDEPGLFAFNGADPLHRVALQDLKILILSLKKEGAIVGLHCCSDTDWRAVLELGINILSFDVRLSLPSLLKHKDDLELFLKNGGRLSLGIVPTNVSIDEEFSPAKTVEWLKSTLEGVLTPESVRNVLKYSLLTPACGLALKTIEDAELINNILHKTADLLESL